jgi:hypothetical protein
MDSSLIISSAAYFTAVAFVAAIVGQHCVRKLIAWLGRASLIIFILASMIFVSALTLGIAIVLFFTDCELTKNSQRAPRRLNNSALFLFLFLLKIMRCLCIVICRRWGRHLEHSAQDAAASVHGVRKPLQGVGSKCEQSRDAWSTGEAAATDAYNSRKAWHAHVAAR